MPFSLFNRTANRSGSRFEKKLNRTSRMGANALRSHSEAGAKKLTFDQHNRIFFRYSGIGIRGEGIGKRESGNTRPDTRPDT